MFHADIYKLLVFNKNNSFKLFATKKLIFLLLQFLANFFNFLLFISVCFLKTKIAPIFLTRSRLISLTLSTKKYIFLKAMSDKTTNKLISIQQNIKKLNVKKVNPAQIICVSKTFALSKLLPLIDNGHRHFGENKVQETELKWSEIKKNKKDIKLHMVGRLQTNKVKKAVKIFDFIHSVDSKKLADSLKKRETEINRKLSYFIQINLGNEVQKGGINKNEAKSFLDYCSDKLGINVIGLMAIPPFNENPEKYFNDISSLNFKLGLKHLSLGMSNDYSLAIKYGSTFVRIGSAILGERKS